MKDLKKTLQLKFLFSTCRHCKNCPRKHSNLMETSSHFGPGPCSHTQPQVRRNQLCICTSEIPSVMTIRLVKICGQSNNRNLFAQLQKLPANALMQQKPCFHIHRISRGKKTTGGTLPTPVLVFISRKLSRSRYCKFTATRDPGDTYIYHEPDCVPHLVDLLWKKIMATEAEVQAIRDQTP
jgi:hypothetical protein